MGGKERRPRASAWPVHGDDPPQRLPFTGAGGEDASGRPCQLAAIGRPQEEPLRSGLQGPSEGLHRLGGVHGKQRASVQLCRGGQSGRCHDGVRFELTNGFGQLVLIGGGRDHAGPTRSVEEVQHLLGYVVLLEREDNPRNLFHARSIASEGRPHHRGEARESLAGDARRNRPAREH